MEDMGNTSPFPSSSSGEELPDFSQVLNGAHQNTDAQVPDNADSFPLHIAVGNSVVDRNSRSSSTDSTDSLPSFENVLNTTNRSPSTVHGPSSSEAQTSAGTQNQEESSTAGVQTRSSVQSTLDSFRLPPVMPNLADQALQRLKEKEGSKLDEEDEFQPTKKRRVEETGNEDEGQQCSICFEPWSNSGTHRISSLRCGHLFGQRCIEKWLKTCPKCPQCNAKAKASDVRVIYAKAISVVDTTGRDRALQDLENEKNARISAQKAEAQAILQYQLARAECDRLKEEIRTVKEQLERYSNAVKCEGGVGSEAGGGVVVECVGISHDRQGKYELYKSISMSQNGNCRVLGYDPHLHMLVATRPSNNALFPGYGLCKVSTVDLQHCEYVPIHSANGVIRDVAFSPRGDGMVLTASTDKSIKLTSMQSNSVVQIFQTSHQVWACTWDQDQPHFLYCGLQNGVVQTYDTRNTANHVEESKRPTGGACPITSLAYVPLCRAGSLSCGGVLMGTLGGCVFWEKNNGKLVHHPLTSLPEGACTSLTFDPITRHCLSSFRPCRGTPYTRHTLFKLRKDCVENKVCCQAVNEFKGGYTHKLLSRSRLIDRPSQDGRLLAAFGDEATKSAQIWDVSSSRKLQQLSLIKEPALDMLSFGSDPEASFLSVLTDSKLFVYKWTWQ